MKSVQSSALLVLTLFALTLIAAEPDPGAPGSVNSLMDVSNEKMYPPNEECHLQFLSGGQ